MLDTVTTTPRYSDVDRQKSDGATYTPIAFARFVAEQMLQLAELPKSGKIRILDPACGDGALLDALIKNLPPAFRKRVEAVGYDTDPEAIWIASQRLRQDFPDLDMRLEQKDFLEHVLNLQGGGDLFSAGEVQEPFHLVIANPPYVRTQIMGAQQAQQLAQCFGLTGRVDLYYPFLLGISQVLADDGVTGVITSNRFMTTKSGQAVRRAMLSRFRILHAWDLGDTKLFDAAVLPSVLLARGTSDSQHLHTNGIAYSSIYETNDTAIAEAEDVLSALNADNDTVIAIPDGRHFRVRHGVLDNGGYPEGIWRVSTQATDQWLTTVEANTWDTFRRIGKIRVGVKSTADKVFIRNDWSSLPDGRPELLRPLITRKCARRFKAVVPENAKQIKEILYPHEVTENGRVAVDLGSYPKTARYLEKHRAALEARTYLIDAGRKWYELWVPQDPAAWPSPKLVFPDISDKPIFWIDTDGGVVNGECYWLQCENKDEQDLLWLALAVANSSFIEAFYDHRFNNKLYAGRRRYITQYVELFPLPSPKCDEAMAIIDLAKIIHTKTPSTEADQLAAKLDAKIWRVFGLPAEEVLR
ncbi:MAG: N-6 DNA methylase [Burkholderiales bacterium]|jgi:adenine-specific DNA-methyltransferase|nr:N-6 DNA methylase [Burkholderiales bacterium]MCA3162697.1 N-6 DNA methylase [Burkholderiales bacterium]MCA3164654.1 N-6 DNA methylase [Burkholderiales bacterium]MCA3166459.1 N-6 DNA methylase [Burkholderiales bacterium]MCA3171256.1 N-6 DNA methylase [Burkholderiales bacterium]